MNLADFLRIHRGLSAALYDWRLVFGDDVLERLEHAGLKHRCEGVADEVMDYLHPTRLLPYDKEMECLCPIDSWPGDMRKIPQEDQVLTGLDLEAFAKHVAYALGLPTRATLKLTPTLVRLSNSPIDIYCSTSCKIAGMNEDLSLINASREKPAIIFTLVDFSDFLTQLRGAEGSNFRVLTSYVQANGSDLGLRLNPDVNFSRELERLSPQRHSEKRLPGLLRPARATYDNLHFKVYTSSRNLETFPDDDMFECWYDGEAHTAKFKVSETPRFFRCGAPTHLWGFLREAALKGGRFKMPRDQSFTEAKRSAC